MRRLSSGFTLLEIIVILAILGVLMSIAGTTIRSDRIAVRQTAQAISMQIARTRLEALKQNDFIGLHIDITGNRYVIFKDKVRDGLYTTGDEQISATTLGGHESRQAKLGASTTLTNLVFDPRGILYNATDGAIAVQNTAGNYTATVSVNAQGRSVVQ